MLEERKGSRSRRNYERDVNVWKWTVGGGDVADDKYGDEE